MAITLPRIDIRTSAPALMEAEPQICGACGKPMALVRVETKVLFSSIQTHRDYECAVCGTERSLASAWLPKASMTVRDASGDHSTEVVL